MKIRYAPLAVACALMLAAAATTTAQAAVVTYSFGGTLFGSNVASLAVVGDTFTGTFSFESTAPDLLPTSADQGQYTDGFAISGTVNGFSFSSSSTSSDCPAACGRAEVFFNIGPNGEDGFVIQNVFDSFAPVTGPNVDGFSAVTLRFELNDSSGTAFNSDALPLNLTLSSFDFARFSIGFGSVSGPGSVEGFITDLTLTTTPPIPEPSTTAMLALGIGALAFARRRKIR